MLVVIRSVMVATIKVVGTIGLGGVILWHVADHSGAQTSTACVHVWGPNMVVTVDGREYDAATLSDSPLVIELGPGRHKLQAFRDGQMFDEREFTLGMGEETVLVPGDQPFVK
jgi:hypothetical protein